MLIDAPIPTVGQEAKRLDRLFPGWYEKIDLETLNLSSLRNCILGQTTGMPFDNVWPTIERDGVRGGKFETIDLYCFSNHEFEWVGEIEQRRAWPRS